MQTPPASPPTAQLRGLSADEVAEREAAGRTNAQPRDTSRSLATILRVHVLTLFNLAIGLCALVVVLLGRWFDLLFSLAAVANVVIGVVQEYSAKRTLDRIALLHEDEATVVREGERVSLPMAQIVIDDVVVLRRGDQVPVDGEVLASDGLDLDEALLTGENEPVPKHPGDAVLSGSSVVAGTGLVRATAVGADSHAAPIPCRVACWTLVTSVGTISSASAMGAGRNDPNADIMIIGIANPIAPLTKPAASVTAAASISV